MADFPGSIFSGRVVENLPGVTYDPTQKRIVYAEDYSNLADEVHAVEDLMGADPAAWPYPSTGNFWDMLKKSLSYRRGKIVLAIGSGLITPAGFNLALIDPLGLGRTPTVVAIGGQFNVVNPPNPIATYEIFVCYSLVATGAFSFTFMYRNYATGAIANTIAIPFGAVITGEPSFIYDIVWA